MQGRICRLLPLDLLGERQNSSQKNLEGVKNVSNTMVICLMLRAHHTQVPVQGSQCCCCPGRGLCLEGQTEGWGGLLVRLEASAGSWTLSLLRVGNSHARAVSSASQLRQQTWKLSSPSHTALPLLSSSRLSLSCLIPPPNSSSQARRGQHGIHPGPPARAGQVDAELQTNQRSPQLKLSVPTSSPACDLLTSSEQEGTELRSLATLIKSLFLLYWGEEE